MSGPSRSERTSDPPTPLAATHEGSVVVVTGAAGGIGSALVDHFSTAGAAVVATDMVPRSNSATDPVMFVIADLATPEGADRLVAETLEHHGRVDVLVNNAGGGVILPFLEHDEASMQQTIDRNLWTAVRCCRAVLPTMVERKYGRIVNIGAESVRNGLWEHAMYNAAKGGVHGLTTGLAREFAPFGITVNTVAPAGVDTPRMKAGIRLGSSDLSVRAAALNPSGRRAEVAEVAALVGFVALPIAGHITGQVISINGGSSMM